MVKLRDRVASKNVIDNRAPGATGTKTPGRGGAVVAIGFLAVFGGAVATVSINGVNWALGLVGLDPISFAPPLTEQRGEQLDEFAAVILGDTERIWGKLFAEQGRVYAPPTLVLYTDEQQSQCGLIQGAMGPVYCAFDQRIYMDLSFFNTVAADFGAEGDFPPVYVIAHEVGHHVQNLTGDLDRFFNAMDGDDAAPLNQLQVRLELQADCLAGVFTNQAEKEFQFLESGDVDEGITAATRFGDDVIQKRERGYVSEASFTHGSGEQRARWFQNGFENGRVADCDTWSPDYDAL